MEEAGEQQGLLSLTTEIVAAFAGHNTVATSDLPGLIGTVYAALRSAGAVEAEKPVEALVPAVPIKKSVMPEFIVCLEDGKKLKMLKRHLATQLQHDTGRIPAALGLAERLSDGGPGLCGPALGSRQEHRAWPQAG